MQWLTSYQAANDTCRANFGSDTIQFEVCMYVSYTVHLGTIHFLIYKIVAYQLKFFLPAVATCMR